MIIPESEVSKRFVELPQEDFTVSEPPPGYSERLSVPIDKTRITYTFMPQTVPANSMVMSPPKYLENSHPHYFITVNMNCFTPSSYITTIMRDNWQGEMVGDFEMGISSRRPSTVFLHGYEYPLNDVLEQNPKVFRLGSYLWRGRREGKQNGVHLYWEESSSGSSTVISCFYGKEKGITNLAAMFMPANPVHLPRRPGRSIALSRLEITPTGQKVLDEVVISILIIERIRTAPSILERSASKLKEFF